MSIARLLLDRASIERTAKTFAAGQWTEGAPSVVATAVPCRVSLKVSGRDLAQAGQERVAADTTIYFDKSTDVQDGDTIIVSSARYEALRVVANSDSPYRAALARKAV